MAYEKAVRESEVKGSMQVKNENPATDFVDNRDVTTQLRGLQKIMAASPHHTPLQAKTDVAQRVLRDDDTGDDLSDTELDAAILTAGASADEEAYLRYRHGLPGRFYFSTVLAQAQAGQRAPASNRMSARTAAGYVNPSHRAPSVRSLFLDAALSPRDTSRDEEDWLFSPSRRFEVHTPTHTSAPDVVHGHGNTVMGHGPVDAVDDWNSVGHTRPRSDNLEHNRDVSIYHGLEHYRASASSGGRTTSRYVDPSPAIGSHPSHYDVATAPAGVPWPLYSNVNGTYVPVSSSTPSTSTQGPTISGGGTSAPSSSTPAPTLSTPAPGPAPATPFWMAPHSAPMFTNTLVDSDDESMSSDS